MVDTFHERSDIPASHLDEKHSNGSSDWAIPSFPGKIAGRSFRFLPRAGSDVLVIFFSGTGKRNGKFDFWRVGNTFDDNVLFVSDGGNLWYQEGVAGLGNTIEKTVVNIRRWCRALGIKRIVTVGSSMGGYGAVLYGSLLKAKVLALSFDSILRLPTSPSAKHMPADARALHPDLVPVIESAGTRVHIYAGEMYTMDIVSALRMASLPSVTITTLRGVDHSSARFLENSVGLKVLISLYARDLPLPRFVESGTLCTKPDVVALLHRAHLLARRKQHADCIDTCKLALMVDPQSEALHYLAGTSYFALRRVNPALHHLGIVAAALPHFEDGQFLYANTLRAAGQSELARQSLQKQAEKWPKSARIAYNLALCHEALGDFAEATAAMSTAVDLEKRLAEKQILFLARKKRRKSNLPGKAVATLIKYLSKIIPAALLPKKVGATTLKKTAGHRPFSSSEIKAFDHRAQYAARHMLDKPVGELTRCIDGVNIALGVGQSFMGGSANSSRLNFVPGRLPSDRTYKAKMLGESERGKGSDGLFEPYGAPVLNPLKDTLCYRDMVYSDEQMISGQYHPRAKGCTPLAGACLFFENLWRISQRIRGDVSDGFDVAVNVSKSEASLVQISSSPAIDRTLDALDKVSTAVSLEMPGLPVQHTVTFERHGQNGENVGDSIKGYMDIHRSYRLTVNAHAKAGTENTPRVPWIGTQVSGAYGSPQRRVAQAQLAMALEDDDFFIAAPDYPFPHLGKVTPPHPRAGDRHPTANATLMAANYMAWARFYVQVLRRNWFPTHIFDARFRGPEILVSFRAMRPPLRISEVCVSTTMTMIHALGFDVEDDGVDIPIVGVPELVGALTFRIICDRLLKDPIVGLAKGSFGLVDIGRPGSGATNIKDSQDLATLFRPSFESGYTDMLPGGMLDNNGLEDIEPLLGRQDMSNWAVAQRKRCKPFAKNPKKPLR